MKRKRKYWTITLFGKWSKPAMCLWDGRREYHARKKCMDEFGINLSFTSHVQTRCSCMCARYILYVLVIFHDMPCRFATIWLAFFFGLFNVTLFRVNLVQLYVFEHFEKLAFISAFCNCSLKGAMQKRVKSQWCGQMPNVFTKHYRVFFFFCQKKNQTGT